MNSGTNNVALGVESTDANVFIAFKDSGTTGTFGSAAVAVGASSDNLLFRAGSAEVGRFTSAGRFGINRTSPNGLLHLKVVQAQIVLSISKQVLQQMIVL